MGIKREKTSSGISCKLHEEEKRYDSTFGVEFIELPCIRIHSCKFKTKIGDQNWLVTTIGSKSVLCIPNEKTQTHI